MRVRSFMSALDFGSSSFLSCEKDTEEILKKLFISSKPYSNTLKKLLVINNKDCLDATNVNYDTIVENIGLAELRGQGYIKLEPKIEFEQNAEVKSYIVLEFNSFSPNMNNPGYRDAVIDFNILCHTDHWDIGDYQLRPIKIMGYIDGILNKTTLSGIGRLEFLGANEIVLDENLSGYLLRYQATHGTDDIIPIEE